MPFGWYVVGWINFIADTLSELKRILFIGTP
jgi:hypothetical protein